MSDDNDRTADRLAIIEVIARYSQAWDGRDPEAYASLFAEDAVFEAFARDADEPVIRRDGRDAILVWARERSAARDPAEGHRHHQSGTIFDELEVDRARTRTMLLETRRRGGRPEPWVTGIYTDDWRRTPEGWRFAKRSLRMD